MDVEGMQKVIGADIAFKIKAIFCSPFGAEPTQCVRIWPDGRRSVLLGNNGVRLVVHAQVHITTLLGRYGRGPEASSAIDAGET